MNRPTIVSCCNRKWPRYLIKDRKRGYWTGKNWTHVARDAQLYCKYQHAIKDLANLELKKPTAEYKTSVNVDVFSDKPIDLDKLKDYLAEQAKLVLEKPAPDGATVHVRINWDNLAEEVKRDCSEQRKDRGA